jgi:hypothetical protein
MRKLKREGRKEELETHKFRKAKKRRERKGECIGNDEWEKEGEGTFRTFRTFRVQLRDFLGQI